MACAHTFTYDKAVYGTPYGFTRARTAHSAHGATRFFTSKGELLGLSGTLKIVITTDLETGRNSAHSG